MKELTQAKREFEKTGTAFDDAIATADLLWKAQRRSGVKWLGDTGTAYDKAFEKAMDCWEQHLAAFARLTAARR